MTTYILDPLGDGISKIDLMDHMGSDLTVVNAARVSMAKESDWEVCSEVPMMYRLQLSDKDTKLISYLAKHKHWTPFSHPQITLRIKMPIFIARQWFKHMVGFTRNEMSRRYVDDTPEIYVPTEWRLRASNVKQGSSDQIIEGQPFPVDAVSRSLVELYKKMLFVGVCPEQARMVLPQSMYTEFVETGSLAGYARLCSLRLDPHAQKEVRLYAEKVSLIMEDLFPVSWSALTGESNQ